MSALHAYQAAFTAHLRHPSAHAAPRGTDRARMAVYREIVFNNFMASVSACFPVLRSILGKRKFTQLVRLCFHSQQFTSPLFRDIPQYFADWLQTLDLTAQQLPVFTAQLAHYEWVELYLANLAVTPAQGSEGLQGSDTLRKQPLQLNPAHVLLAYDYPVNQLSKRYQPAQPEPTFLYLLRKPDYSIQFIQLNAISWQLLSIIEKQALTGEQALTLLAQQLHHPQPQTLLAFGDDLLRQLHAQHVLI